MTPVIPSSPPLRADDSDDSTYLREMYKRYMLIPSVARWLLSRDRYTEFRAVRKEVSVMVSVSSASSPTVIPEDTPDVPFPASTDLMFLDHVQDGFALGHVWGNLESNTHPYAPLAMRAGMSGWNHVQSRKFACDLTINGSLEIVEYTWFADNRAMVSLSRIPCQVRSSIVRTSEVLFFDSVERSDVPPQNPALVLLLHDRSTCTSCGKKICCCPNTIGIERATPPNCHIAQDNTLSGDKSFPTQSIVQSWEDRARVVSHGKKRGLLTIVYNGSCTGNFSQITVRQWYVSTCADQEAIEYRIQRHLAKLWSRMPQITSPGIDKPAPGTAPAPPFNSSDEGCATTTQEGSPQSPISFAPKEGQWFDSSRESVFPPSELKLPSNSDKGAHGCYSSATQIVKLNELCAPAQGAFCNQQVESGAASGCAISAKRSREVHISENKNTSGAPALPPSSAAQETRGEEHGSCPVSLCGPEKKGKVCHCSAEKMHDLSLARILNTGREQVVSHGVEDMTYFMEPAFASSPLANNNLPQPISKINPAALIANMSKREQRREGQLSSGPHPDDNQDPNSTRCGTSTTLHSPLPRPPSHQLEPPQKRPRIELLPKSDTLGFSLEAGWHSSGDDRDKPLPVPAWNGAGGNIERPYSSSSRAAAVGRSRSPITLMSTLTKTPPIGGQGFSLGKATSAEFDFQRTFDPLAIPSLTELSKHPDDRVNFGRRTNFVSVSGPQQQSLAGRSRNTSSSNTEVAPGSDVRCDICGITFAKRSNKIRHIQTVHNRIKQFACDICGTRFGLKADLGRHRFRIHESRAFQCDSCGKSFAEKAQLDHHVRVTHEEDSKPWECVICRMRFGRKSSLTRHEQTVHQRTRFQCRFCKKSYSQKFDAVRHERRIHGGHDKVGSAGIKQLVR